MKLIGDLKEQVENANSREEARQIIEKEGIELTDEEMNQVGGGRSFHVPMNTQGNDNNG